MKYDIKIAVTDEVPGVKSVIVRTWVTKNGVEKENTFIHPTKAKLTAEDDLVDVILSAIRPEKEKKNTKSVKKTAEVKEKPDGVL